MAGNRFGRRIRKLRKKSGTSLRKFAEEMQMSAAYLSRIETGKFPPPAEDKILAMADALGADRDELLALAGKVSSDIESILVDNCTWLPSLVRQLGELSSGEKELLSSEAGPRTILVSNEGASALAGLSSPAESDDEEDRAADDEKAHASRALPGQQDLFSQLED